MLKEQMKSPPRGTDDGKPKLNPPPQGTDDGAPVLDVPKPKRDTSAPTTVNTDSLVSSFPNDGLKYGMKRNLYVHAIQKWLFGFPPEWQTGNYLQHTRDAVKDYIQKNNIMDVPADGSVFSRAMYKKIYDESVAENGSSEQTSQNTTSDSSSSGRQDPVVIRTTRGQQQKQQQPTKKTFPGFPWKEGVGKPEDGYDTETFGFYIKKLQRVIRAPMTGVMDKTTFEAIKKFINDPKHKVLFGTPIDQNSLDMIEGENPMLSQMLFQDIIRAGDVRATMNLNAKKPSEHIDEMRRLNFKLKRYFK